MQEGESRNSLGDQDAFSCLSGLSGLFFSHTTHEIPLPRKRSFGTESFSQSAAVGHQDWSRVGMAVNLAVCRLAGRDEALGIKGHCGCWRRRVYRSQGIWEAGKHCPCVSQRDLLHLILGYERKVPGWVDASMNLGPSVEQRLPALYIGQSLGFAVSLLVLLVPILSLCLRLLPFKPLHTGLSPAPAEPLQGPGEVSELAKKALVSWRQ